MNVPLYATALIVFAILYIQLSVFLLAALAAALLGMAIVLALQVSLLNRRTRPESVGFAPDPTPSSGRSRALKASGVDQMISLVFIAGTWGIFAWLAPPDAQLLGPGWQYPSRGWAAVAPIELWSLLVGIVLLVGVVGWGWYRYAVLSSEERGRYETPLMIEPIPPGELPPCQFSDAYRFSEGGREPPTVLAPTQHSGDFRFITLIGPGPALPRRFALCREHGRYYATAEAIGRRLVVRR